MQRDFKPYKAVLWVPATLASPELRRGLAEAAGGLTAASAEGVWIDPEGGIWSERIYTLTAYYDDLSRPEVEDAYRRGVADLLAAGQQSVLVEIDGDRELVSA